MLHFNNNKGFFSLHLSALLVAAIGIFFSILAFMVVDRQIKEKQQAEFEWVAHNRNGALKGGIEKTVEAVTVLRDFFRASKEVTPDVFQLFAQSLRERYQGIQALMWVSAPHSATSGRDLPTHFMEPMNGNEELLRLDMASSTYRELFDKARETGEMVLSHRLPLGNKSEKFGFLAISPIVSHASQSLQDHPEQGQNENDYSTSFAVGFFRIGDVANSSISLLEPRGVAFVIMDETVSGPEQFLDFYASRLSPTINLGPNQWRDWLDTTPFHSKNTFKVANRTWSIICAPTPNYRSAEGFTQGSWGVLIAGLFATMILALYLYHTKIEIKKRTIITNQLREREELLSQMTETIQEIFWVQAPPDGRFLYISPAYEKITGLSRAELIDKPLAFMEAIHPEDKSRVIQTLKHIWQKQLEMVCRIVRPNGTIKWLRWKTFPIFDDKGNIYRTVGISEDITEIMRAEEALRESEKKLRALFYQSPDIIRTVDQEGTILLMNRGRKSAKDDLDDSSLLFPPKFQQWYRDHLDMVFKSGEATRFEYSTLDGICWSARIVPMRRDDKVVAAMLISTDVTENRILQSQAIQNARLASIGMLASGVAHEINNPNNAIYYNASLAQKVWQDALPVLDEYWEENGDFLIGNLPYSEMRLKTGEMLGWIVDNSNRIKEIVSNLKYMSRRDKGGQDKEVNLLDVIKGTLLVLNNKIQQYTDHFTFELPETLPLIQGNFQQLEQVLINLVFNALLSLPDRKSRIKVSACFEKKGKGFVSIMVEDEGTGIELENMEKITEPFFTTRSEEGGTGLGLSISYDIIRSHQGSMQFKSKVGQGTTVTIRLPLTREPLSEDKNQTRPTSSTSYPCR
ncbi:MAG: PAS domain S-box protein [Magnetococcales bacterium]|nr:PAS domain S-box protein [Magnetococcales bacterium]